MNEIKIYHSVWKNAITIIISLTMAGLGIFVGIGHRDFRPWGIVHGLYGNKG